MPELDSITVKGFKSIASIEALKLGAINVLIGDYGSGKSNFVGVFSFLNAVGEGSLQEYVIKAGGAEKILHFGSKVTKELHVRVSFEGGRDQYEITLQPTEADELVPHSEIVLFWDKERYPERPYSEGLTRVGKEAGISGPRFSTIPAHSRVAKYVQDHLARWRLYHFHDTGFSSSMKKTGDVNDNRYLCADGANLAAFLYYLREKHGTSYSLILRTIR